MHWKHRSDPEWLKARKNFLTASEIVKLLPTTPTGRKRTDLEGTMFKIWATKQCLVQDEDVESSGVMARGHILEKYAIDAYNLRWPGHKFYHWDDALIYTGDGIAMSPDGLDVEQPEGCPVSLGGCDAKAVIEIKSFNPSAHYEAGVSTTPELLPERWQIAVAMYVMPTIEFGELLFFNPSAEHPMFIHTYDRLSLADELEIIEEVGRVFWAAADDFQDIADASCDTKSAGCCRSEAAIIAELLEAEADASCLNP